MQMVGGKVSVPEILRMLRKLTYPIAGVNASGRRGIFPSNYVK